MDLYELRAFLVLQEQLHYARAASRLNMSPSALSRIVTRLEEELDTPLIDRSSRSVKLTENGKQFAEFARETLEREQELKSVFMGEKGEVSGILNVYASVTACYMILPLFIKKLSEKYPLIKLSVQTGDPAGAIQAVRDGSASLAVAAIPEDSLAYLETIKCVRTPLVYAASKDGPYTSVSGSPQDILSSTPIVLPKNGIARERFDRWTKSRNVHPIIAAETEGNEAILAIAQLGLGIGLVPQLVLESAPYKNSFVIHSAGNTMGYYDVGFIRRSELYGSKGSRLIQKAVGDVLSSISKEDFVRYDGK